MEHNHSWELPFPVVATHGPLEGEWEVQNCESCWAFLLFRADGADPEPNLVALGV